MEDKLKPVELLFVIGGIEMDELLSKDKVSETRLEYLKNRRESVLSSS